MLATPLLKPAACEPAAVVTVASPGGSAKVADSPANAARAAAFWAAPALSVVSEAVMVEVAVRTDDGGRIRRSRSAPGAG